MKEIKGYKISENYILESDENNLILHELGIKINPKNREESFGLKKTTYHANIKQVFNYIIDTTMYSVDLTNIEKVVEVIEELKKYIDKFENCVSFNISE